MAQETVKARMSLGFIERERERDRENWLNKFVWDPFGLLLNYNHQV